MENRTNNKTTNSSRTAARTTNSTGEHKHPNQYTKGADDEGAKNSTRNCR